MSEQEVASSSSEAPMEIPEVLEKKEEFTEPDAKKRKISKPSEEKKYKLEERLGGILCCAVCLDLPRAAVYQLVKPAKTRWGTLLACFESLLKSEEILLQMVNTREFVSMAPQAQRESRQRIKDTISDENFVNKLKKGIHILGPVNELTTKFQADNVPISEVYLEFTNLPKTYTGDGAEEYLSQAESTFIKSKIKCTNGHLMCAGCFTHVLADARLRDEMATCPSCRVEISKTSATRNLAVENAVSELPSDCQFCGKQYPRNSLERHEEQECEERIAGCKYSRIGCPWRGPQHERQEHENQCAHPHRTGAEVMDSLLAMDQQLAEEKKLYDNIFDLLGYEKITFNDIQLKPYRTDEFVHRLFYESSRFSAFNNQWVVKARINNCHKDPTQSSERDMTYQLILKSKSSTPLSLNYIVLRGPVGDIKVKPRIHEFDFTEQSNESPYVSLPLPDTTECNRLLAAKTINFRLIMFLASK